MKLKTLASAIAALAAAAVFAPAHAGINPNNDGELFFVAFNSAGSYTKDLGISMPSFLGTSGLANTSASNFSFNVGSLYSGSQLASSSATRWAIYALDWDTNGEPFGLHMLLSGVNGTQPAFGTASDLQDQLFGMVNFAGTVSQTGTHTPAYAANGESYNASGTPGYYGDTILTPAATFTMSTVGANTSLYVGTDGSYDNSEPTVVSKMAGVASFNGTTISYAVAAVPEPESIALMLAGLGLVGAIARRRRA